MCSDQLHIDLIKIKDPGQDRNGPDWHKRFHTSGGSAIEPAQSKGEFRVE